MASHRRQSPGAVRKAVNRMPLENRAGCALRSVQQASAHHVVRPRECRDCRDRSAGEGKRRDADRRRSAPPEPAADVEHLSGRGACRSTSKPR